MGTTISLRQSLMGVCLNTQWKYAVFWKLRSMELILEDFYIEYEKPAVYFNEEPGFISFGHDIDVKSGSVVKCPIELALTNILFYSYKLGEGIVGQVASERRHQWISCTGSNSMLLDELPADWKHQILAGIKTVVLVPVLPLGVVQLGSFEMILENISEVIRIKDCFEAIHDTSGTCIFSSPTLDQINTSIMPSRFLVQSNHQFMLDTNFYANGIINDRNSTFSNLFPDYIEDTNLDLSAFADSMIEADKFKYLICGDESNTHSFNYPSTLSPIGHPEEGFFIEENPVVDPLHLDDPFVSELHEVPFPSSTRKYGPFISKADEWNHPIDIFHIESGEKTEAEYFLDTMIAQLLDTSENDTSHESTCINSCSNSSNKCSDSCFSQYKTEDSTLDIGDSVPQRHKRSLIFSDKEDNVLSNSSTTNNKLTTEQQNVLLKDTKSTNSKRKHGDSRSHKPKPRDRQLIQDRIKELRDLIPDGSKCSIDALLDRTIKHMIYLGSIPGYTEKMGHFTGTKVDGKHLDASEHQTSYKEATQDYNTVHRSKQCPLIVENLGQPGQIRIEMQCEDYGLFLEIAQVIRRLKLTILNGIMETKSDNLWARFVIEVPVGFHQTDLLWPLVKLLQRDNNGLINKMFY